MGSILHGLCVLNIIFNFSECAELVCIFFLNKVNCLKVSIIVEEFIWIDERFLLLNSFETLFKRFKKVYKIQNTNESNRWLFKSIREMIYQWVWWVLPYRSDMSSSTWASMEYHSLRSCSSCLMGMKRKKCHYGLNGHLHQLLIALTRRFIARWLLCICRNYRVFFHQTPKFGHLVTLICIFIQAYIWNTYRTW